MGIVKRVVVLTLSLTISLAAHGYSVEVNKVMDFPKSFRSLAMLPAACPSNVDCLWVESLVLGKLLERKLPIKPASAVRKMMFEMGVKELDDTNRRLLAQKLNVDAFVVVSIDSMTSESVGTTGVLVGNVFTAVPSKRNVGSVQLAIISAETGKPLMESTGYGESSARPKRGVIGKTFNEILSRAFPPQFYVDRAKK